jgi:thiol-disulfide isomerase/thioredoxin
LTKRETIALILVCVVSAGAGFGAWRWHQASAAAKAAERRPDFAFKDLDGKPHALSEWDGKLVLLNFWATWCAPCLKEIPLLVEAQSLHAARGLQIVGVAVDEVEPVRSFAQRLKINYPLLAGGPEVYDAMRELGAELEALPFSVLIAPDGRIVARASGDLSAEELKEWLDAHLPST